MRGFFSFVAEVVSIVIIAALAIFAVENALAMHVSFLGRSFTADLWWLVVGAAVLGFLLALLLLAPGRVAAGWRGMVLQREGTRREQELAQLRRRHTQLQAEQERLQAEHEWLQADHAQLAAEHDQLQAQRTPAARPIAPTAPATAARSPGTQAAAPASPAPAQTPQTAVPTSQAGQPEQQRPPTLGERLRAAAFAQSQQPGTPKQDQTWIQGPTAPTT